jgi:hypothetical protein
MLSIFARQYDEAAAKAAWLAKIEEVASTQDLSEDLRSRTKALSVAFTVLAAVIVALRFFARWKKCVHLGTDDWLMLVSLVLLVGNMAMNLVCKYKPPQAHEIVNSNPNGI